MQMVSYPMETIRMKYQSLFSIFLHEMSKPTLWDKYENDFKMSSAELLPIMLSANYMK